MRLRKNLPELEVALAVEHTYSPVAALEAGEIDVALVTTSVVPRGRLEERQIFSDEVVFIMSASHPLAARKTLTPADVRESMLLIGQGAPAESHWLMASVFGRARPRLHIDRLPLTEAILDVARAGMGVAVLSEWIASPHLGKGDLVAKRLVSGPLRRPWRLAWRREVDDAALRLLSALEATAPRGLLAG